MASGRFFFVSLSLSLSLSILIHISPHLLAHFRLEMFDSYDVNNMYTRLNISSSSLLSSPLPDKTHQMTHKLQLVTCCIWDADLYFFFSLFLPPVSINYSSTDLCVQKVSLSISHSLGPGFYFSLACNSTCSSQMSFSQVMQVKPVWETLHVDADGGMLRCLCMYVYVCVCVWKEIFVTVVSY